MAKTSLKACRVPHGPAFTLVYGADWMGLYRDGILIHEGQEVTLDQLAEAAGLRFEYATADDPDVYLREHGGFPQKLANIVSA